MPWIAAIALCALIFLFPKKGGLLLSLLAAAALLIWGGIWGFNAWQDTLLHNIAVSVRLPEYPSGDSAAMPESWTNGSHAEALRNIWQSSLSDKQKRRKTNNLLYGCADESPLLAGISNGNKSALLRYGIAVEAYQPGRSTNLAGNYQYAADVIIPAGGQKLICIPAPRLKDGVPLGDVIFNASIKEAIFE